MFCSLRSEGKVEILSNTGSSYAPVQTIPGFNSPTYIQLVKGDQVALVTDFGNILTIKESAGSYSISQNLSIGVQVTHTAISDDGQSILSALLDKTINLFFNVSGTYVLS